MFSSMFGEDFTCYFFDKKSTYKWNNIYTSIHTQKILNNLLMKPTETSTDVFIAQKDSINVLNV